MAQAIVAPYKAMADAELVLEEPFVTTGYAHMSMEPRTAMAYRQDGWL